MIIQVVAMTFAVLGLLTAGASVFYAAKAGRINRQAAEDVRRESFTVIDD